MSSDWQTLASETKYENNWISVREDSVVKPDGSRGIYGVVSMQNPAVFVVAITDNDEVVMESLYRYATDSMSWEVPAGGSDGQDPLMAAQRELLEETGLTASSWEQIGFMNALNGVCNAPEYVYLATGLSSASDRVSDAGGPLSDSVDVAHEQRAEGIAEVKLVPWPDVMSMVARGDITDGETVAALMYAAVARGRVS